MRDTTNFKFKINASSLALNTKWGGVSKRNVALGENAFDFGNQSLRGFMRGVFFGKRKSSGTRFEGFLIFMRRLGDDVANAGDDVAKSPRK